MMTPKEALIQDNLTRPESERIPIKEGRGRMSREAVDRIKHLVSNGAVIRGYEVAGIKPAIVKPGQPAPVKEISPEVKRVNVANVKEVKEFTIFWPEESFKAVYASTGNDIPGKHKGMREVCNTCRVSLVQNQCENPTILNGIKVSIKPR